MALSFCKYRSPVWLARGKDDGCSRHFLLLSTGALPPRARAVAVLEVGALGWGVESNLVRREEIYLVQFTLP
jgi:hypothetical protein